MSTVILRFPGTNCEFDMQYALETIGQTSTIIWHKETVLPADTDVVIIPGGFSYGDYLRSGSIAKFSPIMQAVIAFAREGGTVLGICNGFQILLESGLLPGAMKRNANLHFISKTSELKVENNSNAFLSGCEKDAILSIPIAHAEGNYHIDDTGLQTLRENGQILLTYVDNPNGSVDNIAGICNDSRNVFGLMPHPERAVSPLLGSTDGIRMLEGLYTQA